MRLQQCLENVFDEEEETQIMLSDEEKQLKGSAGKPELVTKQGLT